MSVSSPSSVEGELTHKPAMSSERRQQVLDALRHAVPLLAKERREKIKANAAYASLCIVDAFQGRLSNGLANNSKKSYWIYTLFRMQTSDYMYNAVVVCSILHSMFIFFEPQNACSSSWLMSFFQCFVVALYATDVAMKMGYEGIREYFKHDWQQLYFLNAVCIAVDLAFCGCTLYSNPLRPLAGLLRARKGRKFFEVLKKMVPLLFHNLMPVLYFALVVMTVSSLLFDADVPMLADVSQSSYNWWFLILTNDTFDRLMTSSAAGSLRFFIFFFVAIYIGQRFLLSLVIGDTYNTYKLFVKQQLKKERLKEMQGLTKAFTALDDEGKGYISDVVWRECLNALSPDLTPEAVALYFELISGGTATISLLQFLSLRSIISFRLAVEQRTIWNTSVSVFQGKLKRTWEQLRVNVSEPVQKNAAIIIDWADAHTISMKLALLDVFLLCGGVADYRLSVQTGDTNSCWCFVTANEVISGLLLCEFLCRVLAAKGNVSQASGLLSFSSIVVSAATLFLMLLRPFRGLVSFLPWKDAVVSVCLSHPKTRLLLGLIRGSRLAMLSEDLRDFNAALYDVFPTLIETISFTFVVSYCFGTLGALLFSNMDDWKTPFRGIVTAQKLTFMVDFLSSMEDAMEQVHVLAIVYFFLFLILSLTVSNIALSIIIDLHSAVLENKGVNRESQRRKIDLVFDKLVSQAKMRRWWKSSRFLDFKKIRLHELQSSDVRHFIADAKSELSLKAEDLSQCQKYSKINLSKLFRECQHKHQDVHWEVDLVNSLHEIDVGENMLCEAGTKIFDAGDSANTIYVLLKGSMRVTFCSSVDVTLRSANIVGTDALQPNACYSYSCLVIDSGTEVVAFDRDALSQLSAETRGGILQMAMKSASHLGESFANAQKKQRSLLLRQRSYSPSTVPSLQ